MIFFLNDDDARISSDYHAPRKNTYGEHRAWDFIRARGLPLPIGTTILAPEDGTYHYQLLLRRDYACDLSRPDGTWWPYSRYYADVYGAVLILFGELYTHVFAHLPVEYVFERWERGRKEFNQPKIRVHKGGEIDYTQYITPRINWSPFRAREGRVIGETGDDGYSTMEHLHYQCMEPGSQKHDHVDPADVFPEEYQRRLL